MTIARSETSLNEADYLSIPDSTGSMSAQITLQRYGPVWTDHPNDTDNGRTGECFDATLVGQYLVRAYGSTVSQVSADYMPSEIAGVTDASWTTIDCTNIDNVDEDIPISLIAGTGLALRLFYVDTSGVLRYSDCADVTGNAFGAPSVVCSPSSGVGYISAVSTTRVHYITRTDKDNRWLHYADYDGSWSVTDSEVYWPFIVYSLDAVALTDRDLLSIATDIPPLVGSRIVGTEVQNEIDNVQALVTFEVVNGRWSDWLPTDTVDRVPDDYVIARDNARMSYHNSLLFTTYDRAGGDGDYEYSYPAVIRSGDGRNWEYPELIPDASVPYVILPRDDYLYAVGISGTLRSPRCAWAGQDPVEYDVTPHVLQLESQAAEIRNSSTTLANPAASTTDIFQGALAGELPLSDDRLQLKFELGYWLGGNARKVHVSTEDVIQRGEQRQLPHLGLSLGSQDYLGRVNRVRSDYAAEWPGMQCGRDPFEDTTGTGYGGLRHMAPIKPSFKAEDGILQLISNNKEAIAISTFVSDTLCGSAQTSIDLVNDDKSEYQGIVFQVFDKDNLHFVAYYPDDNVFKLYKRVGADNDDKYTDTLVATSNAITDSPSWAGTEINKHWMKVLVRYNKLTLYRSDNGLSWQVVPWTTGNFVELDASFLVLPVYSGRFGVIGYGYSDVDVPPIWIPDPWDPPIPDPVYWGVVALSQSQLALSTNFFEVDDPHWTDLKGGITGTILNITVGEDQQAFLTATSGLWYCGDILDSTPTWSCIKTRAAARTETGLATAEFRSVGVSGHGTVYAGWHQWSGGVPMGFWSGTGGGVNYATFPAFGANNVELKTANCTHNVFVDGETEYIGCGGAFQGLVYTGGSYLSGFTAGNMVTGLCDGFVVAGTTQTMYSGWSSSSTYTTGAIGGRGFDVLRNTPVYTKGTGLYLGLVQIAQSSAIFNGDNWGGKPSFARNDTSEVIWIKSLGSSSAEVIVAWTEDAFTNWLDKTGDLRTAIGGEWLGSSGSSGDAGNAITRVFPYRRDLYV